MTDFDPQHWTYYKSSNLFTDLDEITLVEQYHENQVDEVKGYGAVTVMRHSLARLAYVLQHTAARAKWVSRLQQQVLIEGEELDREQIFYESYRLLWPLARREYVLYGKWELEERPIPMAIWEVSSVKNVFVPRKSATVRARLHKLKFTLSQLNNCETEVRVEIKVDHSGKLPIRIKKWLQERWCLHALRGINLHAGKSHEIHSPIQQELFKKDFVLEDVME